MKPENELDDFIFHPILYFGNIELTKKRIEFFLEKGNDINSQNRFGRTMLHIAYLSNREDVGKYLIAKGIDVAIMDNDNKTAADILSDRKKISDEQKTPETTPKNKEVRKFVSGEETNKKSRF